MKFSIGTTAIRQSLVSAIAAAGMLTASAASADDDMKLALNWLAGAPHIGFFYAQKLGYYEDAGINLTIEEGRGSGPSSQMVATGRAEVAFASVPTAMNVTSKGGNLTVISPVFQANPYGLISLKGSGINTPEDIKGKKIAGCNGCAGVPLFNVFAGNAGIGEEEYEFVTIEGKAGPGLLERKQIDAVIEVPSQVVFPLQERGIETQMINFRDHGVSVLNLGLVANANNLGENPDLYKRFLDASLKGWAAAYENPTEAMESVREKFPEAKTAEQMTKVWDSYMKFLLCPNSNTTMGRAPDSTWDTTHKILTSTGSLPSDVPVSAYFSNDYLPTEAPSCS